MLKPFQELEIFSNVFIRCADFKAFLKRDKHSGIRKVVKLKKTKKTSFSSTTRTLKVLRAGDDWVHKVRVTAVAELT